MQERDQIFAHEEGHCTEYRRQGLLLFRHRSYLQRVRCIDESSGAYRPECTGSRETVQGDAGTYVNTFWGKSMKQKYIGISEDRLHHILGVARKAYEIAKDMGYDECFCRRCFMLGWLHDVGYEFSEKQSEHSYVSEELLRSLSSEPCNKEWANALSAIRKHGAYTENETAEWKILNMADMQIDSQGNEVNVSQRLEDIRNRYGEHSNQYLTACDICYRIGLTPINLATNIE